MFDVSHQSEQQSTRGGHRTGKKRPKHPERRRRRGNIHLMNRLATLKESQRERKEQEALIYDDDEDEEEDEEDEEEGERFHQLKN